MDNRLITAAVLGLLAGGLNRSRADILYDACHKALASGGTVVVSKDGKTFTYTTCDKAITQTYSLDSFSFERGKACRKQGMPNVSCKAKFSCMPVPDPPDPKTYVPSCVGKLKK